VDLTPPTVDVETPANGSVINNPLPVYSGTVEAGSTVSITVDGTVLGNATVTGTRWEFTPTAPLPAGAHTVTAIATDAAGNTATDSHTFTVDLTPPAVDVETPANGSVINNPLPVYSGTVEAGSTVTITVDGVVLGNATVTGTRWEFIPTTPLGNGAHTVTATATDAAGNTATDSHTFTVDLTPPAVNVETPVNGSVTNNPRPVYSGTVEAGSTVTITVDGVVLGNATVTGTRWTFTPTVPLADGPHTVTATATDAVGNTATDSNTFSVDTMGPAAPEVRTPPNGSITNDSTPTYGGTAEPGSTVTIYVDGVAVGTTTADAAGNWTFTPTAPLADGPHTVSATAEDALGNTSPNSNTNTFTVDTTAPAAPEVRTPANGSSTPDNTPTYSGTAEPGSTVEVFVDGASVGTTTADTNGNWNLTPVGGLAAGQHTVKATATDAAGNTSPDSNTNTFTVASIAPQAPVITGPENNTVTDDNTPAFTGTAPPGNTVTIILNGTPVGTTTADANGNWSFTPTTPLEDGPYELTVTATDPAGNVSAPSSPVRFTVETEVAPPLPEGDKDFLGDGLGCASTAGDPSALAMMGLALLAVLGARRRQR
jgi:MYXO-CTERM domain-containing protein